MPHFQLLNFFFKKEEEAENLDFFYFWNFSDFTLVFFFPFST